MLDIHDQRLLIIDFGAQYTQLIARRVRECGIYCEIQSFDMSDRAIRQFNPKGIILSGGPESVTFGDTPRIPDIVFDLGVPVLGICYGMQAMAEHLGGRVASSEIREFGHALLSINPSSELFRDIGNNNRNELNVWMSHGDKVVELPANF